jgi:protein required for attachment to host cells
MRKALPEEIRDHVLSEINKDFTHLALPELEEVIPKHLS